MKQDITPIMTPERILGALIWQVWNGQLDDRLIVLGRTLPDEFIRDLEGDLDVLVQMIRGANVDPIVRKSLISTLKGEITSTLQMLSGEQKPGKVNLGFGEEES